MKFFMTLFLTTLVSMNAQAYQKKDLSFDSHGSKLKGTLYLPQNYKMGQKTPTVVVTGAWTTVKEQMAKNYAIELTKKGFAAFTFDFRGWGESEGKKRFVEDPVSKTQDIIKAVEFFENPIKKLIPIKSLGLEFVLVLVTWQMPTPSLLQSSR